MTQSADTVRLLKTEAYDIVDEVEPLYAARTAEEVRVITKKTWWATLQFQPILTRGTDQVHWGRIHPDYERTPYFHALCGWSKKYNKFEMVRTKDSVSCKRCQQSAKLLTDGQDRV